MLISFIIPVYNVRNYIGRCVRSIAAAADFYVSRSENRDHDNPLFEVVCVDDGSTDGSGEILDGLAAGLPHGRSWLRIEVVRQKNSGVSVARNTGLDRAAGRYIFFVDSDDCVKEDFLERAIAEMHGDPELDIWIGQRDDVDGEYRPLPGPPLRLPVLATERPVSDFLRVKGRYWLYGVVGKLYRRDFIERHAIRFVAGISMGEDSLFMSMAYARARRVKVSDTVCYVRCQRGGSLVGRHWADLVPQYFEASRVLEEYAEHSCLERKLSPQIAQWALSRIRTMLAPGYSYEWMSRYIEALCRHPDFKRRVPWNIFRHAAQPYKTAGLLLLALPPRLAEVLFKLMIRFKRK